jgi:hypothetical protein
VLGKAVLGGFALGAVGLGTASYLSADGSDLFFSPEEQAMMGAFVGAFGGALAGLLLWAAVVVAERALRLLRRTRTGWR